MITMIFFFLWYIFVSKRNYLQRISYTKNTSLYYKYITYVTLEYVSLVKVSGAIIVTVDDLLSRSQVEENYSWLDWACG